MTKLLFILLLLFGCSPTEPENVHGCLDSQACNYNSNAINDDGSCYYATDWEDECGVCDLDTSNDCILGCTEPLSINYNSEATENDGTCLDNPFLGMWHDVESQYSIPYIYFDYNSVQILSYNNDCYIPYLTAPATFDYNTGSYTFQFEGGDTIEFDILNDFLVVFPNDDTITYEFVAPDSISNSYVFDSDFDGICDDEDECIGIFDECGVCNGNGMDSDDDGVCDDIDDCVGSYDCFGICNGEAVIDCNGVCGGNSEGYCDDGYVNLWCECYNIEDTTELDLSGDNFYNPGELSGEIPSEIGDLVNLTNLSLSQNQLTGNIPSSIGNLINLESLLLISCQLTGNIPSSIGNLINLETLALSNNQLTGEIPSFLENLTNLEVLSLFNNQFTGEIPSFLGTLPNLTHLYLNDNQLSGEIPQEVCDFYENNDTYLNLYLHLMRDNELIINTCF